MASSRRWAAIAAPVALGFPLAVKLSWWGLDRSPTAWDDSAHLDQSLQLCDALREQGVAGLYRTFMHKGAANRPLFPLQALPFSALFGRSVATPWLVACPLAAPWYWYNGRAAFTHAWSSWAGVISNYFGSRNVFSLAEIGVICTSWAPRCSRPGIWRCWGCARSAACGAGGVLGCGRTRSCHPGSGCCFLPGGRPSWFCSSA